MNKQCPECGRQNSAKAPECENCGHNFEVTNQTPQTRKPYPEQPPKINSQKPELQTSYPEPPPKINNQKPELQTSYPEPPPKINNQKPEPPPKINNQKPESQTSYPEPPPKINNQKPESQTSYPALPPKIQSSLAMKITCPQCHHEETSDTQYCGVCGYEFTSAPVEEILDAEPPQIEHNPPVFYPSIETSNTQIQTISPQPNLSLSDPVVTTNTARLIAKQVGTPVSEFVLEPNNIIGRFDPDTGPVEIDLEEFPAADYVSRHHAEIYREGNQWKIQDLGSENGVFIKRANQSRFHPRIITSEILNPGDEIAIGKIRFIFQSP